METTPRVHKFSEASAFVLVFADDLDSGALAAKQHLEADGLRCVELVHLGETTQADMLEKPKFAPLWSKAQAAGTASVLAAGPPAQTDVWGLN